MTVTVDRDRLRHTTAPHLLCERARSNAGFGRLPLQASRHLSRAQLARLRGAGRARRARVAEPRPCARRARRHHGRRLRRVDDLRSRRAIARRHRLRHLSDRRAGRGRIPDARRRRLRSSSPKTRNTSTRSCRSPTGCRTCARSSCSTIPRCSATRTRSCTASPICWPRRKSRSRVAGGETGRTFAGRPGFHRLYVGHHRPSEGRAGQPRQAPCRHRHRRRRIIRHCARSRIAQSSTCRCATCSAATSPSRCR